MITRVTVQLHAPDNYETMLVDEFIGNSKWDRSFSTGGMCGASELPRKAHYQYRLAYSEAGRTKKPVSFLYCDY